MKDHGPRFVGVLGWPLDYTLSPRLHNAAFRALGLDWIYLRWSVPPERLAAAIEGLKALDASGANVTIPHKEAAVALMDELSGDARAVAAVNTIQKIGDTLVGHNTDVDGFHRFLLDDAGAQVERRSAVVLGAGGAARAVVKALDDLGASSIAVACRRPPQGEAVAAIAAHSAASIVAWERRLDACAEADVIVNTTPLGSAEDDAPVVDGVFAPGQLVVDLVYDPPTTPMIAAARAAGASAWSGLGMLVHQAAASFRIWTGLDAPLETMSAAVVREMRPRERAEITEERNNDLQ